MDNLEFCNMLKEAKQLSGTSIIEIVVALRKREGTILSMLNGRRDSTLDSYLPLIKVIGFSLAISKKTFSGTFTKYIKTTSDARSFLQTRITKDSLPIKEVAKKLNVTPATAIKIANGGPLRLSIFLKLAEMFGYTVRLDSVI